MASRTPSFSSIETIRARARESLTQGAVTPGYRADRSAVVELLNAALATEIICVLRYKRHYFCAEGIHAKSVQAEFLEHAKEEQEHADRLSKRIVELGGKPDLNPQRLAARAHSEYVPGEDLVQMLEEDLVAERIAIDTYREMISCLGKEDPTTRRLLEGILANEEEHAEDLSSLLAELGKKGEPAPRKAAAQKPPRAAKRSRRHIDAG